MQSPWSVGVLMIVMAGLGASPVTAGGPVGKWTYGIAAILVVSGLSLLLRRPFAFYLGLLAAGLVVATGALAWMGHPAVALRLHPGISIGIGLYLAVRVLMARGAL